MKHRLSRHAEEEMVWRQIPRAWVESVLESPQQRVPQSGNKEVLQSRIESEDGKMYLLDRKSTRLNSSHIQKSRMPSSA